jgi:glucan-binding YG repeat protein
MKTIAQQLNIKDFPFIIKDKNGNKIYYEDSNGSWLKREYDKNGNKIYSENSDGFWCKLEYDKNGKEIYFEDSNGIIEDNRPKTCNGKVVEIDGKKYKLTEL